MSIMSEITEALNDPGEHIVSIDLSIDDISAKFYKSISRHIDGGDESELARLIFMLGLMNFSNKFLLSCARAEVLASGGLLDEAQKLISSKQILKMVYEEIQETVCTSPEKLKAMTLEDFDYSSEKKSSGIVTSLINGLRKLFSAQ